MEPATTGASGNPQRKFGSVGLMILGAVMAIMSADRLFDEWQAGQTWRIALYALVLPAVSIATVYGVFASRRN
jgi:hypothetical protein